MKSDVCDSLRMSNQSIPSKQIIALCYSASRLQALEGWVSSPAVTRSMFLKVTYTVQVEDGGQGDLRNLHEIGPLETDYRTLEEAPIRCTCSGPGRQCNNVFLSYPGQSG